MGERHRNDAGRYVETITSNRVLDVLATTTDPVLATGDVADRLGCSSEAARLKLTALHDQGRIARRNVRDAVVVWWLPAEDADKADGTEETTPDSDAHTESPAQQLRRLSKVLNEPIVVGGRVYEDGDKHVLSDVHGGSHDDVSESNSTEHEASER